MKTLILTILFAFLFLTISVKAETLTLDTLWHKEYKYGTSTFALSPDGRFVVVGVAGESFKSGEPSVPAKIQTFDAVTGEMIREFQYEVPQNSENDASLKYSSILFNENGDKLYAFYISIYIPEFERRRIIEYDFETGKPLRTLYSINETDYRRDNNLILLDDNRILTWNDIGFIEIIDIEKDKIVYQFQLTYLNSSGKVLYNKNKNLITTSGTYYYLNEHSGENGYTQTEIHLYDGATYEWRGRLYYNNYQWDIEDTIGTQILINSLYFSDDSEYLVTPISGEKNPVIWIWGIDEKEIIDTIYSPLYANIYSILLSFDNINMLFASTDSKDIFISLHDLDTKRYSEIKTDNIYKFVGQNVAEDIIYLKSNGKMLAIRTPWQTVSVKENIKPADNIIYPNPTSGNAEIKFDLKIADAIEVIVSDATGKIISHFPHKFYSEGQHLYLLDTNNMKSGMYIVNLKGKHINLNFKLQIIK